MTDDTEIDELREQHQKGSRISAAASQTHSDEFEDQLVEHFDDVRSGDVSRTLSFRDEFIAGLIRGIEADEDRHQALVHSLQEELDTDGEANPDRSQLLRLAVRLGLREADEDLVEAAADAYGQSVTSDVSP